MIRVVSLRPISTEPRLERRDPAQDDAIESVVAQGWGSAYRLLEEDDVLVVTANDLPLPGWVGQRAKSRLVVALGNPAGFVDEVPPHIPVITAESGLAAILSLLARQDAANRALGRHVGDLERMIDANPDAVILTDLDGKVLRANKVADAMFAGGEGGLAGEHMIFAVSADGIGQLEIVQGDRVRIGEIRLAQIEWNGRAANLAAVRDVTVTAELQDKLAQSQKSDAIRLMAGGIAHEFNNMLVVAMANLHFLRKHVEEEGHSLLDKVDGVVERARALSNQILILSQSHPSEVRPTDLTQVIAEMVQLLRSSAPANIDMKVDLPERALTVVLDPDEFRQALTNVVLNAISATMKGGTITVSADVSDIALRELGLGPWCRIRVTDTGHGISVENLPRIFDPFFTTMPVGQGRGLGLSVTRSLVRKAGGTIEAYSLEGQGATFTIFLPLARPNAGESTQSTLQQSGNQRHVLVIDDDQDVASALVKTLERGGYRVTCCGNGRDGRHAIEADDSIDLVVSDVVMPKLDGRELAEWIARTRPDMKLLLVTGYASSIEWLESLRGQSRDFLIKPFAPKQFLDSVRQLLR